MAALTALRSSTADSESRPSSTKPRAGLMSSAEPKPSTVATCARTRSTSSRSWSVLGSPASLATQGAAAAPEAPAAIRRRGIGTRPRSACWTWPVARRAARSSFAGTTTGSPTSRARSNSAMPSSMPSAGMPERAIRARSASESPAPMPECWSHRPQASDTAGRPSECRCTASASSAVLAAP